MVEKAFSSIGNYLEFFKDIDNIHKAKEDAFNNALDEINVAYGHLLQDDETLPEKPEEFLKPEIPKNKKETKNKRESSRAIRKNVSSNLQPSLNETVVLALDKTDITNDPDAFRRSSRIASKKTLPAIPSALLEIRNEISPSVQSTSQTKRKEKMKKKDSNSLNLEDSIMCAAHSTPISLSPPEPKNDTDEWKTPQEKTPSTLEMKSISDSSLAVEKRIEEFEDRIGQGPSLPSKLPIRTPTKKKNIQIQDEKPCENVSNAKNRLLRSNNVLQEKNTNVESAQTKDKKIKKPAGPKNNLVGNKMKMGVQSYKAMKLNRQIETDRNAETPKPETSVKKFFNVMKKKDLKTQNPVKPKELQIGTTLQKKKETESEIKIKKNYSEDVQYELDHVLDDGSSEDEDCPKNPIPKWATKEMREHPLNVQAWIDKKETVYVWFYNSDIKNPNLEELFCNTIKMRPRTSSAVWNTKTFLK